MSNSIKTRDTQCNRQDSRGQHHIYKFDLLGKIYNITTQNARYNISAIAEVYQTGVPRAACGPEVILYGP